MRLRFSALLAPWMRLGILTLLLILAALMFGILAWREAERARATANVLMKDYASFVAEKFVHASAARYTSWVGMREASYNPETHSFPFARLRGHVGARDRNRAPQLPAPDFPGIQYFFTYEAASGELETSGVHPSGEEKSKLVRILETFDPKCGANQTIPFARLNSRLGNNREDSDTLGVSGLLQTGNHGEVQRIDGLRLDYKKTVELLFVPLITRADDCRCAPSLLPSSLSSIADPRQAASFRLRSAAGEVFYRSEPQYAGSISVVQTLSPELPFSGWTVEVAMNPAAVQRFLPVGGRGVPWLALVLLAVLVLGSGILVVRSLRHNAELFRLRQDFVSNVSHELKTPLSRIRLFNELLLTGRQANSAKRSHYRQVIDRECRRLGILVDNILDFSRMERGSRKYHFTRIDLRQVVEGALETFRTVSDQKRFTLSTSLEDVPAVFGDAGALHQVLINLLDNAVKYSPEGSPIAVRLTASNGAARLAVEDHGFGIPQKECARIFEEFYRVETGDAQRAAGSGLGLALVRRTVEAHAGRVSQMGVGSTFFVDLPLANHAESSDSTAQQVSA